MKLWRDTSRANPPPSGVETELQDAAFLYPLGRGRLFMAWMGANRALFLMVLVVGLIALIPLYGTLFPPLVDLPEHILLTKLLWEKLVGTSHLDLQVSYYLGYRLFTAISLTIIPFFKLCRISMVYFPATVAMALMSLHVLVVATILCSGLKNKSWQSCVLAICLSLPAVVSMYSASWFIGFATYTLGITMLVLSVFLTERFLRSGKWRDAFFLFCSLVLVYAGHPFAPAFWVLWCFSRTLAGFATQTFFLEWKRLICLGLMFLPIVLYHILATRATAMAPSSMSLLTQPAIVSINDWFQYRYRGLLDGLYLQADDAADSRLFAHFAIGFILFAAVLVLCVRGNKRLKNVMLSCILLLFLSSWINEKFIPVPGGAWLAYDYRFSSTVYAIGLAAAGAVFIRLIPEAINKPRFKVVFVCFALMGIVCVLASASHLIEVRKAYGRFDVPARKFVAQMFKHEPTAGISLPHSRWHPNDSRINLYVCLNEPDCNPPGTSFITGYMGDLYPVKLRSTGRVMSAREAVSWRKHVPGGPLVGHWKLDESKEDEACADSSGNGYTGTAHGTTVVEGKSNRARSFNGNGDYIEIPSINIEYAITVAAWVYSENFMQSGFVVMKNPVDTQWALFFESNRFLKWRGVGVGNTVICPAPSNGAWHHIVARQEGTVGRLYVDGVLGASGSLPGIGNGPGSINIGRFGSGDHWYFTGKIDDVRIYNRALSDSEINQLFTSSTKPPPSPSSQAQLKDHSSVEDTGTY